MKAAVTASIMLHCAAAALVFLLPDRKPFTPVTQPVREVQLVRARQEPAPQPQVAEPEKNEQEPERKTENRVPKEPLQEAEPEAADTTAAGQEPGSSLRLESEDFPFSYYLSIVRYRVQENWRPPVQTPGEAGRLAATVGFSISRQGKVSGAVLEESSNRYHPPSLQLSQQLSIPKSDPRKKDRKVRSRALKRVY